MKYLNYLQYILNIVATGNDILIVVPVNNLNLNVGVGNCNISAILKGNSVIEAGVGQLNIDLLDSIDNYKIKLTKGIGDITINDTKITDNNTFGNGNKNISLVGGIGPISITSK